MLMISWWKIKHHYAKSPWPVHNTESHQTRHKIDEFENKSHLFTGHQYKESQIRRDNQSLCNFVDICTHYNYHKSFITILTLSMCSWQTAGLGIQLYNMMICMRKKSYNVKHLPCNTFHTAVLYRVCYLQPTTTTTVNRYNHHCERRRKMTFCSHMIEIVLNEWTITFRCPHHLYTLQSPAYNPHVFDLHTLNGGLNSMKIPFSPWGSLSPNQGLKKNNTVRCRYHADNFLTNNHKRRPIYRPSGREMRWFFEDSASD